MYNTSDLSLRFGTDVTEQARITATGNFGIGTTSPYAKLSVVGEAVASHFTATTTSTSTLPQLDATGIEVASLLEIDGNITFDSVTGNQWSDFCTSITGGSGLCDGTDNTGGGAGLATSTDIVDTYIIYGTSASDVGAEAAFTYNDATDILAVVNASTTALSAYSAAFGGSATTSIDTAGNVTLGGTIAVGGDSINEFAGTGLTVSGNALTADLGTSVDLTSEVTGTLPVANGGTGATSLNNLITLGTHTTGNYLATLSGTSNQITVSGSGSEGATPTLSIPSLFDISQASTTQFSAGVAYFGTTATTTIDAEGDIALPSAGTFTIDSQTFDSLTDDATLENNSGDLRVVDVTCTNCLSGTEIDESSLSLSVVDGFDFSYSQALGYGITGSATSTATQFTAGLLASSTSYFSNATSTLFTVLDGLYSNGSLIISGGDTTALNLIDAIDATTESTFEGALDLSDLQGAVTDGQVPNDITIDLATLATTLTVSDNESTNETNALLFTSGGDIDGGNLGIESDGDLTYNPSSGTLTATLFSGSGASLTSLDGENITNDTIDDDSIDFVDVTLADFTNDAGFLTDAFRNWTLTNGYLAPTTTVGVIVSASSTFQGGVTIDSGTTTNATSTNLVVSGTASTSDLTVSSNFTFAAVSGFLKATAGAVATSLIDLAADVTGILGVANGGTGWGELQANSILLGNGTSQLATTSAGTNGQILGLSGGTPTWLATTTFSSGLTYSSGNVTADLGTSVDLTSEVTGTLPVANGGTGATSLNNLITLGTHTTGNYLATLADAGGLTVANSGSESAAVTVALDLANANSWTALQNFTQSTSSQLSALEAWFGATATTSIDTAGNVTLGGTITVGGDSINEFAGTGLTVSGNALTADLGTSVDLTSEVTGTLPVANGGTGATTFTNNRLLTGNGTSALVDEANLTFDGSLLTITGNASTTQIGSTGSAYFATGGGNANVGIGTTTPNWSLQVSSSTPYLAITDTDAATDNKHFLLSNIDGVFAIGTSTDSLSATSSAFTLDPEGPATLGVGTTSPWRTLSITGSVAFDGLTSSGTGNAVCITTGKDITDAGGGTCTPSSERFKENIETLSPGEALNTLSQLRVVSFDYKEEFAANEEDPAAVGLIAEEVELIDPRLVDYGYDGLPLTLHFERITGLTVQAIQELNLNLETIASSTASTTPQSESFADTFLSGLFSRIATWLSDTANGITSIFTERLSTNELCVRDESGEETCITKAQLDSLLAGAAVSGGNNIGSSSGGGEPAGPAPDTEAPVIEIFGNNPAQIEVGASYADLGASVTDNSGANLGIQTFVNGTEVVTVNIDTSESGTHEVRYEATDQAGNTGIATRTVVVGGDSEEEPPVEEPPTEEEPEPESDTTPPVITLTGSAPITITEGDIYTDEGATATDDVDGDITNLIVVGGSVDTSTPETYQITYDVADTAGNQATQVVREVVVEALSEPEPEEEESPIEEPPAEESQP